MNKLVFAFAATAALLSFGGCKKKGGGGGAGEAMAKMADDTMAPLLMTLALTLVFSSLLFKWMWPLVIGVLACLAVAAMWLWPEPERTV